MSAVSNAIKLLKDEKRVLETELVKIDRAIKALSVEGPVRKSPERKPEVIRNQNGDAAKQMILKYLEEHPDAIVKDIQADLQFSSESYLYSRLRDLRDAGMVMHHDYPKQWKLTTKALQEIRLHVTT